MADKIQIRAGNKSGMPTLTDRELAYVRNEKALYVGTPTGNQKLCSGETEGKVSALEQTVATHGSTISEHGNKLTEHGNKITEHGNKLNEYGNTISEHGNAIKANSDAIKSQQSDLAKKLTASPVVAQAGIATDADLKTAVAAINALIAAMKSSGVMNT